MNNKKDSFRFEYTMPSLDWYDIIKVEIRPEDYTFFKLCLRYGSSWWLIGMNSIKDDKNLYRLEEKELGRMSNRDVLRFIEWSKTEYGGSRLVGISSISSSLNIIQRISDLFA